MFIPFVGRHLRSLVLAILLPAVWGGSAIIPPALADSGDCSSILAFPKPPPVPLSFPKPPPVPLGGISGRVLVGTNGTADVTVSLYRCMGADAVLVGQTVSGAEGAYAFSAFSALGTDHDYYVEVPGPTTQGAYALPGMTGINLQAQ
ncbi:MAG: hypothetical protein IPJ58_10055 [Ardenticatenia bacterium]|nr:hypothetical protein [Ardenticatenia bacterium]